MIDEAIINQARAWRRDFHTHPELAYQEHRTSDIVAKVLSDCGYEVHRGIAKTGLVAVKHYGERATSDPSTQHSIALRADMDALPIHETTGADYGSQTAGIMHACGHDGHTALLMGAAVALADRIDLNGTLTLVFQPAEENEGGARAMVKDGLFDRFPIDSIYGLHNMPNIPVGTVYVRAGTVSAAFDTFDISVVGKGGHGAFPEQANDPIVASSALVSALNSIVSRDISAIESGVVTVGQIAGGDTYNVIPDQVTLKGSCRSLQSATQQTLERRIKEVCKGIEEMYGVEVTCDYQCRYPAIINSEQETKQLLGALQTVLAGENIITQFDAVMGSEDFAFFLAEKPGCYFIIGNGSGTGTLHSSNYDFNDDLIAPGIAVWVALVTKALGSQAGS